MAQLSAPNASGVAMGHLHYTAPNVEGNKKFWVALGGVAAKIGSTKAVRFRTLSSRCLPARLRKARVGPW